MGSNGFIQSGNTLFTGTPGGSGLFSGDSPGNGPLFDGLPNIRPTLFQGETGTSRGRNSNPLFDGQGNRMAADLLYGPALPQVDTFSGKWNQASRTYPWRWDEAYTKSHEDALAMRRDTYLMSLTNERAYAVIQCPWHIEGEDDRDPRQLESAKRATKIVLATPNLQTLLKSCTEASWYGRAGVQNVWAKRRVNGQQAFAVREHWPVNGDKIQFTWEGVPEILIYRPTRRDLEDRGAEVRITDRSTVLVLSKPEWRDRFIIHKHDVVDADFFDSITSGAIHGVGIRTWVYYYWWLKQEMLSYITDFMERVGTGFTIGRYPAGDMNAQQEMQTVLQNQTRESYIAIPWFEGMTGAAGMERVEPSTAGATVLQALVDYYDKNIERFIVGQSMSSGADKESGLGGSGRAAFAKATKQAIVEYDCSKLEDTLTRDFVGPIQRYNDLGYDEFRLRWKFDLAGDDPKAKLEAAEKAWSMGVSFDEDEVREETGFSKPEANAVILKNPQIAQAEQQMAQGAAGSQPPQPGGEGLFGGKPGEPAKPAPPLFQGQQEAAKPMPPKPPEVPSPDRDSAAHHAADAAEDARNGLKPDDRPARNALVEPSAPAIAYLYAPPGTDAACGVNAADWQRFARWAQSQDGTALQDLGRDGHSDPSGEVTAVATLSNELAEAIKGVDPNEGMGPVVHMVALDVLHALDKPGSEGVVVSTERPENLSRGLFRLRDAEPEAERRCGTCAALGQADGASECCKFMGLGLPSKVAESQVCDLWVPRG
jgi:hypothetical protein